MRSCSFQREYLEPNFTLKIISNNSLYLSSLEESLIRSDNC